MLDTATGPRAGAERQPGRALVDGDWVRQPLWILAAHGALISVALPLMGGAFGIALANVLPCACLLLAIRIGDPSRRGFRLAMHLGAFLSVASLFYSVILSGYPGSIIVYYAPLLLLSTAHFLGAQAALVWAAPCLALVVASEFVPTAVRIDPGPGLAILTESGVLAVSLALAVSLRRAYDRKAAQLEHLATTDPLTGLANRLELQLGARHALGRAQRFGRRGALVFLDLDGMKSVNDGHGHDAGDELLRLLAGRIRRLTRGVDVAARIGGDEFVVLLSEYDDPKGAEIFSRKLLEAAQAPFPVRGALLQVSASIGFVEFPQHASSEEVMLVRADEAMYAAKRAGGARIHRASESGTVEVT
ncbi:MAG: GGDEF domain-containing protein [Deltaproteobacteria bacterium]|nr:GGDEF domain-containing protein [Deltaproteobacteria bacterium]